MNPMTARMLMRMISAGGSFGTATRQAEIEKLCNQFAEAVPADKQTYWMDRVKATRSTDKKIEILEGCIRHFGKGEG